MLKKIVTTHWDASGQDNNEVMSKTTDFVVNTLNISLDKVSDIYMDALEDGTLSSLTIDFVTDNNIEQELMADWKPKAEKDIHKDRLKQMVDIWVHRTEILNTSYEEGIRYEGVGDPVEIFGSMYHGWFVGYFLWFAREGWINTSLKDAEKLVNEDAEFSKLTMAGQIDKLIELLEVE